MNKHKPFPVHWMIEQYKSGWTCQELADELASPEWQTYWLWKLGGEYYPSQKVVNKVLKREKCPMRRTGFRSPEENYFWKGGRIVDKHGYVSVKSPGHPHANHNGYVREHRLVMEKMIGRYLEPQEVVHHIDNNPSNNHPSNLQLFSCNSEHLAATLKGKVPNWTPEGFAKMCNPKRSARNHKTANGAPGCNGTSHQKRA